MINAPAEESAELEYPAEFHFRIICDATTNLAESIQVVTCTRKVTNKLRSTNNSSSGRFCSFSISIFFDDHQDMINFDSEIKSLPGVRMLL